MMREKFLKSYANLPEDERKETIIIIDGRPFSWNRCYDEVKANTVLGKKILDKFHKLGFL